MKHMYVIEQGSLLYGPFVDVVRAVEFGETQFGFTSDSSWRLRPIRKADFMPDDDDFDDDEEEPSPEPDPALRAIGGLE